MPMTDDELFAAAKAGLRFCPECGGDLTVKYQGNNINMVGCFPHGDFQLLWIDGDLQIRWRPLSMAPLYAQRARG